MRGESGQRRVDRAEGCGAGRGEGSGQRRVERAEASGAGRGEWRGYSPGRLHTPHLRYW